MVSRVPREAEGATGLGRARPGSERPLHASPPPSLQNYRKSSRHLAPLLSKFVQFTHTYVACSPAAAVAFLQKHSDALQ